MAKPKAKSQEEKDAALQQMLAEAATTNDMVDGGATVLTPAPAQPAASSPPASPSVDSTIEVEQKGENISAAPPSQFELSAAVAPVASSTSVPAASPDPEPTSAATTAAKPASEPVALPTPGPHAEIEPAPNRDNSSEEELIEEATSEPTLNIAKSVDTNTTEFDLASLFVASPEKKSAQMRISNTHYQYLLQLGTLVGEGTGVPEIVYNIIDIFIRKNDAQIQKALLKGLRKTLVSIKKT